MEVVTGEIDRGELGVSDFDAFVVGGRVYFGTDLKPSSGGGCRNQLHDHLMADERACRAQF